MSQVDAAQVRLDLKELGRVDDGCKCERGEDVGEGPVWLDLQLAVVVRPEQGVNSVNTVC